LTSGKQITDQGDTMTETLDTRPAPTARDLRLAEIFADRDNRNRDAAKRREAKEAAEDAQVEANGVTLVIGICDQRRSYRATFATEDQALVFVGRRRATHAVTEDEVSQIPSSWSRLLDLLYPTCQHGLSAWLCDGPGHYPADNQY
jgi:hypothetical protein